jgi:hypothetical protein
MREDRFVSGLRSMFVLMMEQLLGQFVSGSAMVLSQGGPSSI